MNNYGDKYKKLVAICKKIEPYYDVDKIKPYSVYIWTKESYDGAWDGENVFDIFSDKLQFYKNHKVIKEAEPIIKEIQDSLKEMQMTK